MNWQLNLFKPPGALLQLLLTLEHHYNLQLLIPNPLSLIPYSLSQGKKDINGLLR